MYSSPDGRVQQKNTISAAEDVDEVITYQPFYITVANRLD